MLKSVFELQNNLFKFPTRTHKFIQLFCIDKAVLFFLIFLILTTILDTDLVSNMFLG